MKKINNPEEIDSFYHMTYIVSLIGLMLPSMMIYSEYSKMIPVTPVAQISVSHNCIFCEGNGPFVALYYAAERVGNISTGFFLGPTMLLNTFLTILYILVLFSYMFIIAFRIKNYIVWYINKNRKK